MKRTVQLMGGMAVVLAFGFSAHAADVKVYHSVWKGGNANVWFYDGANNGGLDVWQDGKNVNLSFYKSTPDLTSEVCYTDTYYDKDGNPIPVTWCDYSRWTYENGWGKIPSGDFQFGQKTALLSTTVAPGPDFYIEVCTSDWVAGTYTCTQGAGGAIKATWARDGVSSHFNSGVSQSTYQNYTYKTTGVYRSYSAVSSGSVLGVSFVDAGGNVSQNKGVSISKEIYKTKP